MQSTPILTPNFSTTESSEPKRLRNSLSKRKPDYSWFGSLPVKIRPRKACISSSAASLSRNAAHIASVKSRRAPTLSAGDSHGVVPAAGTSALSVVSSSQVFCFLSFLFFFSTARTRASSDVPLGHGLSSATGTALPAPFPSAAA